MSSPTPNVRNGNGANGQLAKANLLLDVLKWIGVPLLGIIAAYGTVMLTKGRDEQRLTDVEAGIERVQKQLDYNRDIYMKKEAVQPQLDAMTDTLKSIQDDVRELRRSK